MSEPSKDSTSPIMQSEVAEEKGSRPTPTPTTFELEYKGNCAYCGGRLMGGIAVGWGECELCGAI